MHEQIECPGCGQVYTGADLVVIGAEELACPACGERIAMWCQACGCTADDCSACVEAQGAPCHWVGPFKCSRCFTEEGGRKDLATNEHE